jgi:hypothetical protein
MGISRIKLKSISRGLPQARKLATPTKDLKLEKCEAVTMPGLLRYSGNVTAAAMPEA